eukprot:Unigene98_Nuclearia_a/m.314 Unigene98_Nuclearia_a/g.314  ORF Unigene98_Nuclearia_a/g.314 Unigene98_Nuclearia_a/m.314 type:complete len:345 (+) Unigene98_Nuclearia_a:27-1061(+)
MRDAFAFAGNVHWFPGHMARGLRLMREALRRVDVVVEVRDARLPLTSVNPHVERLAANHDRIVVYNKADLANSNMQAVIARAFEQHTALPPPLFTNALENRNLHEIVRLAHNVGRHKAGPLVYRPEVTMMVVGIPNVGKSSLINALRRLGTRKGKAAAVGSLPGVTRTVMGRIKVLDSPPTYMIDTPGVFVPHVPDQTSGLKLGLIAAIKDHLVGELVLADFLLYTLNRIGSTAYLAPCGLREPSDDITVVLTALSRRVGAVLRQGEPDLDLAARHFLTSYREGRLGRYTLDVLTPDTLAAAFRRTTAELDDGDDRHDRRSTAPGRPASAESSPDAEQRSALTV